MKPRSVLQRAKWRHSLTTVLAVGLFSLSHTSLAAIQCMGSVSVISVNSSGSLYAHIGYGTWALCNVSSTLSSISAETCRAWYAGLVAAQKTREPVQFYFSTGSSCAAIGDWVVVTPNLYHIDIRQS